MNGYVMPADLRPGSDTRRRTAATALSDDMRGTFGHLRERQWFAASVAGEILDAPPCYRHPLTLELERPNAAR